MMNNTGKLQTIAVYCASHLSTNEHYAEASEHLGRLLAVQGRTLVYGGSNFGYMGVVSTAAKKAGGKVVAVIPRIFSDDAIHSQAVDELYVPDTMGERKEKMWSLADGFIATPGGVGTLDEITEMLTFNQLRNVKKPIGLLNVDGYFSNFIAQMERLRDDGLVYEGTFTTLFVSDDAQKLLEAMDGYVSTEASEVSDRLRH